MSRRKPINHGTEGGAKAHRRHGVPMCVRCEEAERAAARARAAASYRDRPDYHRERKRAEYWNNPDHHRRLRRESARRARVRQRRGRIHDVIADHLEALTMQWGAGVPMAVVVDSILTRHPDIPETSVRRVFHRMVDDGRVECVRRGDEVRYRLNEAEAGG